MTKNACDYRLQERESEWVLVRRDYQQCHRCRFLLTTFAPSVCLHHRSIEATNNVQSGHMTGISGQKGGEWKEVSD